MLPASASLIGSCAFQLVEFQYVPCKPRYNTVALSQVVTEIDTRQSRPDEFALILHPEAWRRTGGVREFGVLRGTSFMASQPRIKTIAGLIFERIPGPELLAAVAMVAIFLGTAALLATPARAQQIEADSYSAQFIGKRRPPNQTDINDCSRWATTTSGFNPGSAKLPPSWDQPKPPSTSRQAVYNRWMGDCLGQRESLTN
jgi:hypothetical protein